MNNCMVYFTTPVDFVFESLSIMKAVFLSALIALFAVSCEGVHQYAATIRPPSYPLAVRAPFSSYWLPHNQLPGNWPTFWQGTTKGWAGIVRVDNQAYTYMGNVQGLTGFIQVAIQKASYITPTQTVFEITAGPVDLTVTFNSPVESQDLERQSIPLSYVFVSAKSTDGQRHSVQVYMDISANGLPATTSKPPSGLSLLPQETSKSGKFAEWADYAQWGNAVLVTSGEATYLGAPDIQVRRQFVLEGKLNNTVDPNFRCISCDFPTMGFAHDLGSVADQAKEVQFVVGHIREENINLMEVAQKALWTHYFADQTAMIEFFFGDVAYAKSHAEEVDNKLLNEAFAEGGQDYADIISLSLRQAYGATEFSGNKTHPLLYQKEISSNGNMQTVDVMYPAAPMWYYMNPLFFQMENGYWPKDYSMHDIGSHYPNATGHPDGVQEDMPVEESANMLLMVANIAFNPKTSVEDAKNYVRSHYPILASWAEYLYFNCLYPVDQLTTDDFIGPTQLNSGLALKGILGLKAFAKISELIEETNATQFYDNAVASFIPIWYNESLHTSGTHLKMEYNVTDGYQFKYNAFQDKLLNFSVVPDDVYKLEAEFYLTKEEAYGIPFVFTHDYTKSDWEMWTAAAFGDASPTLRSNVIANMAKYLRETPSRVAFSDWYNTATARHNGFQCRPVVGGHFALLARGPYFG
ncbi:hypothetical protein Ocin01_05084 [Orchesella cincta]|uniref:Glutaminase A n=1 Tax=Orchesella cincta TaxID=48709 RepID=A0A1D2N8K0_ORCCI|nr:hypothetical protein Ocin01_05084 [Orchesella cincta]